MKKHLVAATIGSILAYSTALANDEINRCSTIKPDHARLACYDDIPKKEAPKNGKYTTVDPVDLILDMKKMIGTKVRVQGTGLMFMGVLTLTKNGAASENIYVSIKDTPRKDQRAVIGNCGGAFCAVTVEGTVGPVSFASSRLLGIQASSLSINH